MKTYVWHKNNAELDSPDTVHHVLAYGTIEDAKEIQEKLGRKHVADLFMRFPKNIYSKKSFNFVKSYLLGIDSEIKDDEYLKTTPRNIGRRQS